MLKSHFSGRLMTVLVLANLLGGLPASKASDPGSPASGASEDNGVQSLTDSQIVDVILEEVKAGISVNELAKSKSKNDKIKQYASDTIAAFNLMTKQTNEVLKILHLNASPDSKISNRLKMETKDQLEKLKKLSGFDFDKAFIDHDVRFHQSMMDTLDMNLVPNTQNEEVKPLLLEKIRPAILQNLTNSQKVQESQGLNL